MLKKIQNQNFRNIFLRRVNALSNQNEARTIYPLGIGWIERSLHQDTPGGGAPPGEAVDRDARVQPARSAFGSRASCRSVGAMKQRP